MQDSSSLWNPDRETETAEISDKFRQIVLNLPTVGSFIRELRYGFSTKLSDIWQQH